MGYERNDRRYGYDREDRGDYRNSRYGNPEDRGFFDRAGDEVRSWFGDEEAERRRRMDELADERYERERGRYDGGRYADRSVGGYRSPDRYPTWGRSNRDEGYSTSGYSRGYAPTSYHYPATGEDRQFETGYPDSYRTRSYADTGYRYGSDRDARDDDYRALYGTGSSHRDNDVHGYGNWRDRQIGQFDRDYDEYRREHQTRFANEFASWRQNRQTQRDSLQSVAEHMEVLGSDGTHVGKVDHVRGDRILLTKTDRDAGGHHHSIPSSWIKTVDDKVHLAKTAAEAQQAWRDEDSNRGLFGRDRDDDRSTNLNRSFSGTY
ncbi:SWFGD domain-containing protein [Nostoc sp. 3335mG]|nr:SWFGD domain-containing protein [Nostoc sp. 3335mG]